MTKNAKTAQLERKNTFSTEKTIPVSSDKLPLGEVSVFQLEMLAGEQGYKEVNLI